MSGGNLSSSDHTEEIIYNSSHWQLFHELRFIAKSLLQDFRSIQSQVYAYGSIARGDVKPTSDIDIIITQEIPSYMIIQVLNQSDNRIIDSRIVMATPNHAIKGHIDLEDNITISFPLIALKPRELSFYDFGGKINLDDIESEKRVPGVDKSLKLVIPTEKGHKEMSILSLSDHHLQEYGIDQEIVEERKRVLKRRDKVGRTGVFLNEPVDLNLGFEGTLRRIRDRNNLVRNRIKRG